MKRNTECIYLLETAFGIPGEWGAQLHVPTYLRESSGQKPRAFTQTDIVTILVCRVQDQLLRISYTQCLQQSVAVYWQSHSETLCHTESLL